MNIFQIFFCDDQWLDYNLTEQQSQFQLRKDHFKTIFPDHDYQLITNSEVNDILSELDKEVFDCFNQLKPYAFRADLARYCLLYRYGGWYFDLSMMPAFHYTPKTDFVLIQNTLENFYENFILYAPAQSEFYSRLIEQSIRKIKSRQIGTAAIKLFGPGLVTEVFNDLSNEEKDKFTLGKYQYFYKEDDHRPIFLNDQLFAAYKKIMHMGRIDQYGFKGTNNYIELWYNKNIYNRSYLRLDSILSKMKVI